jgi:iron complex outermembrane recepter protein
MLMKITKYFPRFLALSSAAVMTAQALAQPILEEVVVTASKKDVSVTDLAAAANVIGGEDIVPGGVQSVRDMIVDVPNLSIGDQFGFARVFMRGIGMTSIDIGGEGAVAFLQDGAIIPRPAAQLMGMFDLAQLEVLRGPQGTLYGRGATAGVINMVTAKPGKDLGGYIRATAGNYGLLDIEGAVDLPLSDALSVRLAGKFENRDGYGTNLFSGEEVDDRDAQAYRVTFAYDDGGSFRATAAYQHYEEDDQNFAFHYFGPSEGNPLGPLAVPIFGGQTVFQAGGSIYDINSDQEAINTRDGESGIITLEFDVADNQTLKSITSFQEMDRFLRDDLDSTDANLFGQNNYTEQSESWSQEVTYNFSGDRLDVLAGAMYFEEELYGQVLVPLTNICALLAPELCGTPVGDFLSTGRYEQNGDVDIEAYGIYAEASYQLTEAFKIIAGVRYNYEERSGTGAFVFDAAGLDVPTNQSEDWSDVTPRLTVEFEPNDNMLLYATYNQAFKSGVINTGSTSPALEPETVDAFEVGLKGSTADGSMRYAISGFYYDYADLQISFVDETSTVSTINAAEAENYGIEVEIDAALSDAFTMDFYATYLSAEYKEFFNGDYSDGFAVKDLSGNTLPNAPEYTFKLGLNYRAAMMGGDVMLRGEYYYQDDVYFTEWNRADAYQEGYGLLNARAVYTLPGDRWSFAVWGRNLADEEVISNNIITAPLYNSLRVGSMLPPRTYGATVSFDF